jgi:hypothetical protein
LKLAGSASTGRPLNSKLDHFQIGDRKIGRPFSYRSLSARYNGRRKNRAKSHVNSAVKASSIRMCAYFLGADMCTKR